MYRILGLTNLGKSSILKSKVNEYSIYSILKVSIWVLVFTLIMLAKEATHLIHLVTRFTEEIFSFLIACVFLTDALKKILYVMWLLVLCSLFNAIKLLFFC